MNAPAAHRVVAVIEGNWNVLSDVRVTALTEWLARTTASEAEVLAAVNSLVEKSSQYPPKPGDLIEQLKSAGALGRAQPGSGDPRTLAWMREDIRDTANKLVVTRGLTYVEAIDLLLDTYREYRSDIYRVWPGATEGLADKGYWDDRLQAAQSLRDEQARGGGR